MKSEKKKVGRKKTVKTKTGPITGLPDFQKRRRRIIRGVLPSPTVQELDRAIADFDSRPKKLSWKATARAMAKANEDWSAHDRALLSAIVETLEIKSIADAKKAIGAHKAGRTKFGSGIAAFDALARLSGPDLVDRINAGVDARAFVRLAAAYGVPADELAVALRRNARTLRGRTRLSGDETEVSFRAYRALARAREVLESEKNASKWMRTPLGAFAGRTPLSMLARDVGAVEVLNVLGRLEHSVIA